MAIISSMSSSSFFYFTLIFTIYLLLNFNSSVNGNSFPLDNQQQQLPQQQQQQQKIDNDFLRSSKSISTRTSGSNFGFVGPRMFQISRSKIPIELDLLVDNNGGEILEQKPKRYDDYGHLRFGKRGGEDNFDDYGHMRFGRSL